MAKPYIANLFNAIILVVFGSWSFFNSSNPSITALIPVVFGITLITLTKGLKNENKIAAHLIVVLTFLVLIGLIKPLIGSFARNNPAAIARIIAMMVSSLYATSVFVKSFIDVRKNN